MLSIQDFIQLLIVGSALSVVIEYIKNKFGTESNKTRLLTIGLALIIGAGYTLLRNTSYWQTAISILTSASAFYAFLLKK